MKLYDDAAKQGEELTIFHNQMMGDRRKKEAEIAENYYIGKHDILDKRIFYKDQYGELKEDTLSSNIKIPHQFFTELVDQKTQYILSKGVRYIAEDDKDTQSLLDNYADEDFQKFVNELVEGASVKGAEYAYIRTDINDNLKFETADYLQTETIVDDLLNEIAVVRFYSKQLLIEGANTTVEFAELYTEDEVSYWIKKDSDTHFRLNPSVEINPSPHVIATTDDGKVLSRSYGRIPFYKLKNNKYGTSDLSPAKALIDDYDLMNSFLSNNLQDYDKPIFVIEGYQGSDAKEIKDTILSTGVIRNGSPNQKGGVDIETYNIPYEARVAKMETDKENIYKFGMGYDTTLIGGGDVTNIAIRSRYTSLDLKCNKLDPQLRAVLKWCLEVICEDAERKGNVIDASKVKIELQRETIMNENEMAQKELTMEQSKASAVNSILAASMFLDSESVLKELCTIYELDFEEVLGRVNAEDLGGLDGEQMAERSPTT